MVCTADNLDIFVWFETLHTVSQMYNFCIYFLLNNKILLCCIIINSSAAVLHHDYASLSTAISLAGYEVQLSQGNIGSGYFIVITCKMQSCSQLLSKQLALKKFFKISVLHLLESNHFLSFTSIDGKKNCNSLFTNSFYNILSHL